MTTEIYPDFVDRTLHYADPADAIVQAPPAVDRAFHRRGPVVVKAARPLPDTEPRPAVPYDPWTPLKTGRPGPIAPLPATGERRDMGALRVELSAAHEIRHDAEKTVAHALGMLKVGADRLAELKGALDTARAEEHEAEQVEVARMHAALQAGAPLIGVQPKPLASAGIEAEMRPVQALVGQLETDLADRRAAHVATEDVVARITSDMMQTEAEVVAVDLWEAKQRVAALALRLDTYSRAAPPHLVKKLDPAVPPVSNSIRKDLGGGNFIVVADLSVVPPRFEVTPTIGKAMNTTPGLDRPFDHGNAPLQAEHAAWDRWAEALKSDAQATIAPVPEHHEAL